MLLKGDIVDFLYTVLLQLFTPWSPWFYRRMDASEIDTIKKNSRMLMLFCFFLCIGLFTVAPEMIRLFLSKDYIDSIYIVAPICIGIFFQMMYKFFYDVEYFYKKNGLIAIFSVITAILNIILNYFGLKIYGYQAAAYTTLISYFVLLILHYMGMRKVEKRSLFDIRYLVNLSTLLIFVGFINLIFVSNYFLRYLILVIVALLIFIKYNGYVRDTLKIFIKK